MSTVLGDLRIGLRTLRKAPTLTALVVATLALGIGANSAIFSVIHSVLLRDLPYPDADRLVQVWNKYPMINLPQASVAVPDYFDRREQVEAFEESALYFFRSFNLTSDGPPQRIVGVRATASLFPLVHAEARLGRVFSADEDEPGRENVVVLSHGLWTRLFGADPAVVGRDVRLDGVAHRVLGVMPEDFELPNPRVELWKPFAPTPEQRADTSRGQEFCSMLARLAPGATIEQAQAQIDAIHERNKERFPQVREFWESSGFGGMVVAYREQLFGDLRPTLLLLQAVVGLVLLIACANVANLLLSRLANRQRELALRAALGAGRRRLARQLLTESLLVAILGGAAGLGVGFAGVELLGRFGIDPAAGTIVDVRLDATVVLFTFALALATGLVFGLLPALSLWRSEPNEVLHETGGRGASAGKRRLRHALVVAEMALALTLLAGAGLLIRTFLALQNEDPGFDPRGVLTAQVSLQDPKYDPPERRVAFFDQALERIRALPGVTSAGIITDTPFSGSSSSGSYAIDGYTPGAGEGSPHGFVRIVDEDYFSTMGIPRLAGRGFTSADGLLEEGQDGVVIVDRTLVDKYWPNAEPLGQRLRRGGPDGPWYRVVGVVDSIKIHDLEKPITKETLYLPYRQDPAHGMSFVIKAGPRQAGPRQAGPRQAGPRQAELAPESLTASVRQAILAVDPELPAYNVTTLEQQLAASLQTRRVSMVLLVTFSALALVLAAVGIYGVLAFSVAQRVREIGTRVALGAAPGQILRLVVGQGMALTLLGVAVGVALSLALGRLISSMLFGVSAHDPVTFAGVAAVLAAISFLACYRPARRATRIAPVEALREQ